MAEEEVAIQEEGTNYLQNRNLVPPNHYTSKIWKYFRFKEGISDNKFVFCGLCAVKLKYCHNTTNMVAHLKGVYPLFYASLSYKKIHGRILKEPYR